MAGNYTDPDMAYKAQLQQGELNRRQTEADTRNKQLQLNQDQVNNNQLLAQKYALDQSNMMQSNPNNPRSVTDTSMTISNSGDAADSNAGNRRLPTGGFGSANPQIDGRYMSLVNFTPPNLGAAAPPPREVMPEADYSPVDAKAFQDAAFARLKDKSGALGQSAIQSLSSQLAGRGINGASGTFARGTAHQVVNATQPLADLNVAQLGDEYAAAQHAQDLAAARANSIYQGGIAQRGQDISYRNAMDSLLAQFSLADYQGKIGQRGQDLESLYRMFNR